ncbi:MAG: hypothetical protein ACI4IR_02555 [Eubacterium sp.]
MKKVLKSFVCMMLAALICFSSSLTVLAAANDVTPVISVHGMGATALYKNPNTEEQEDLPGFDMTCLLGSGGLVSQLLSAVRGDDVSVNTIIDKLAEFMAPYSDIALDKNGNPMNNIGIKDYWTDSLANHPDYLEGVKNERGLCRQIVDKIGTGNVFAFNYDWRLDACENAKKLNSFIEGVKSQTGKSKVTIICGSEGTVVTAAYIDAYKSKNDIKRVVFVDGAFNGVNVTKAFKQDLVFDSEVVKSYLRNICDTLNNPDLSLSGLRPFLGLFDIQVENLCGYLTEIVSNPYYLNKLYNEVLKPLGTIPVLWEFIPYDDFNECVNKMSSIGFLDKSSGLYSKISNYHKVQGRLQSNLNYIKNHGTEIAIIANYGTPAIPVTSAYAKQSDILIESELQSLGATIADFGSKLDRSGKYVSADKVIDASTCMFPDNTWFVKGIQHMNFRYDTEVTDFVATLTVTDSKINVASIEKSTGVGQFIGSDMDENIVDVNMVGSSAIISAIAQSTSSSEKKSPLTGDNTMAVSFGIAFTGAFVVLIITAFARRKKSCKLK